MKPATLRLLAAAVLFSGWIGWLAYLAWTQSKPIVLSRPQFLVSTLDVSADLKGGETPLPQVIVREVHWPKGETDRWLNKELVVSDLPQMTEKLGWRGAGRYILALQEDHGTYHIAYIPHSPGYPARSKEAESESDSSVTDRRRIYPLTADTEEQLRQIRKSQGVEHAP